MESTTPVLASPPSGSSALDCNQFVMLSAMIGILLVVYNIVAFACCCAPNLFFQWTQRHSSGSLQDCESQHRIPASKYLKEEMGEEPSGHDCSVCLLEFSEGEDVRRLPQCRHLFHATCIDMWLYSHLDCPLCRAKVVSLPPPLVVVEPSGSRLEDGNVTVVVQNPL